MAATPTIDLTSEELQRYSRHLLLPEVGFAGQRRLKAARVLLVGAGGLGSPAALYLAAAGVGTLGILDFDVVDITNLHRQVLHSTAALGERKTESAARRLSALNPDVSIETHAVKLSADNALDILGRYDVIVDGTDNFPARYLVNDACVMLGKPNVYGSIYRFEGQASVFDARRGPCYRCMFPEPPPAGSVPSCAEAGVLGVLPGIIGSIQATETIKLILGTGELLVGRLLVFDALDMRFRELKLRKDPACVACGDGAHLTQLVEYDQYCAPETPSPGELTPEELQAKFARGERFELLDVRDADEIAVVKLPNTKEIPLADLKERLHELDRSAEIVAYCLSGNRSGRAVRLLREEGFSRVAHLTGGLQAWVDKVDPSLPRYW
jgi:sulfur-carrier protein adenylyltransferase/sulfurtransferase